MNQQLQFILDLIQQNKNLSAEEKDMLTTAAKKAENDFSITEFKLERTEKVKRTTAILLEETIQELELKRKAVEEQNHELEIESALERVRSVAMGMKKREDMLEICKIIAQQLDLLDVKEIRNVQTAIFYEEKGSYMNYQYYAKHDKTFITDTIYTNHDVGRSFASQMLKGKGEFSITHIEGRKKLDDWIAYQRSTNVFIDDYLYTASSLNYYWYSLGPVALGISAYIPLTETEKSLFKRFLNVFELAYRRYLDIEKAEAQAMEAKIEAALEKVRSHSLAVHKSDEFNEVIKVVFERLQELKIPMTSVSINVAIEGSKDTEAYICGFGEAGLALSHIRLIHFDHPIANDRYGAYTKGLDFFSKTYDSEEKNSFFEYEFEVSGLKNIPTDIKKMVMGSERYTCSVAFAKNSMIVVNDFAGKSLSPNEINIVKRFAKVFEQAYIRFLDMQKAEAQARESEIELGLERVRARAMAMQRSDELSDLVDTVFKELTKLDFNLKWCIINIIDESSLTNIVWAANPDINKAPESYLMKFEDYPFHHAMMKGYQERSAKYVYVLQGEEKKNYDEYLFNETEFRRIPAEAQAASRAMEKYVVTFTFSNFGGLQTVGDTPLNEASLDILSRFGKVFDLTYTRFNDLRLAEAQAREAQIEAALERVRSLAMSMMKSEELIKVCEAVFTQLQILGFRELRNAQIYIRYDEKEKFTNYNFADYSGAEVVEVLYNSHPNVKGFYDTIAKASDMFAEYEISGKELEDWKSYLYKKLGQKIDVKLETARQLHYYFYSIGTGALGVCTFKQIGEEELKILKRFRNVFDLSYKRYTDIALAEAQAREAKIETALERVRARALAMQQPEELKDVAQVLRNEMGALGVEELETCSIYIHGDSSAQVECWFALQDPKQTEKKMVADHFVLNLDDTWVGREMKKFYQSDEKQVSVVMQGVNRKEWIKYCYEHSPVFSGFYGETIPDRTYHLYKFSHGYIDAAAPGDISAESWKLLSRAASVFSLAYSRFRDLTQARMDLIQLKEEKKRAEDALSELQSTQKQLVQSEKMASLGELTAGIAHEIQNPLNFVNNFSDVSTELLTEMKQELTTGNLQQAAEMADEVIQNLEKILHHGKRADGIVKSMLQHSRTSSGKMEPTDINALCDECFRLAYHGLRAKDKTFNAAMKTDYDDSIGLVNVLPQDFGRVILNLITNAFYAVTEKKKQNFTGYEPVVAVSTRRTGSNISITVADNGTGIPQKVLDKIFQPFFTTKPTGQGTGLGLSLSYDIITKGHGGELKVETAEGEGSTFIIRLPV